MAELGVDALLILPFTMEFSRLSPEDFVRTVLAAALRARLVVEGPNFRFGHKAAGNVASLTELGPEHGFEVEVVDLFVRGEAGGGEPFSSTLARRLVGRGRRRGRHGDPGPSAPGRGRRRPRRAARPEARLSRPPTWRPCRTSAIPADGVYAGWLVVAGRADARRDLGRHQPDLRRHRRGPSRRTPSTAWGWTCTGCTLASTSSPTCAGRRSSTRSTRCSNGWRST